MVPSTRTMLAPGDESAEGASGEGFSADRNAPNFEMVLPEGEYRIQLTGSQSPGILSIYMGF